MEDAKENQYSGSPKELSEVIALRPAMRSLVTTNVVVWVVFCIFLTVITIDDVLTIPFFICFGLFTITTFLMFFIEFIIRKRVRHYFLRLLFLLAPTMLVIFSPFIFGLMPSIYFWQDSKFVSPSGMCVVRVVKAADKRDAGDDRFDCEIVIENRHGQVEYKSNLPMIDKPEELQMEWDVWDRLWLVANEGVAIWYLEKEEGVWIKHQWEAG